MRSISGMLLDARRQQPFQLRAFEQRGGQVLAAVGEVLQQVLALIVAGVLQAGRGSGRGSRPATRGIRRA